MTGLFKTISVFYHHHVIQIIMKIIQVIIIMLVITCWLLGSFEALPASALAHGQQDKQPSCRSLINDHDDHDDDDYDHDHDRYDGDEG